MLDLNYSDLYYPIIITEITTLSNKKKYILTQKIAFILSSMFET